MVEQRRTKSNINPGSDETTWFCVRRNGVAKHRGWINEVPLDDLPRHVGARRGDVVEVCVGHEFRPVEPGRFSKVFCERTRGLVGMEIAFDGEVYRAAPTWMLATNRRFQRVLDRFLKKHDATAAEFTAYGSLQAFSARQFLLSHGDEGSVTELFRGAPLVSPAPSAGEDRAADLARGIEQWMRVNLSPDGALPYKYWPSRGVDSPADNAIRRFLASLSLARLGELRHDAAIREAARRNLRFNLRRYFRNIGEGRGAIVEPTGAKLGAAAIAALAILESPASSEFLPELHMLTAGVNSLADKDRGFRTFYFPPERDGDNWNFYSGEALLFWAEATRRGTRSAPTLERCAATFACCRNRHYRARNPAFIPWHTQACASLYKQTGRSEFADFALEANDWLLSMQQWDRWPGLPPDLWGRFYDPLRPEFGPPHAASTGAYLEGLADAMTLAREIGDQARTAVYERAIARGLRSLRQLQFRGPHDAFYLSRRERVIGALRTEAYDNAVRIDSASHALAAAVKVLEQGLQSTGGST